MHIENTLILSGSGQGTEAIAAFLKNCGCQKITIMQNGNEARRSIRYDSYALILINAPLQDEFGHELIQKLAEATASGLVLLCRAELLAEMQEKTAMTGAFVVAKPMNRQTLSQAVRMALSFHHRLLLTQRENERLRLKVEELRYMSRAKCLLITERGMSEEEAHRHIEKMAMDTRRTKREVSLEIIGLYDYDES